LFQTIVAKTKVGFTEKVRIFGDPLKNILRAEPGPRFIVTQAKKL